MVEVSEGCGNSSVSVLGAHNSSLLRGKWLVVDLTCGLLQQLCFWIFSISMSIWNLKSKLLHFQI